MRAFTNPEKCVKPITFPGLFNPKSRLDASHDQSGNAFWHRYFNEFLELFGSHPKKAPTIFAHNLSRSHRILTIFIPFERGDSGLSNGINIVKIRYNLLKLWPKLVDVFSRIDRKIHKNHKIIHAKMRLIIFVRRIQKSPSPQIKSEAMHKLMRLTLN